MEHKDCMQCGQSFKPKKSKQKFCSISCGCKFHYNNKLKNSSRKGGLRSAQIQSENRRSLNETYFADLCKTQFADVEINKAMFNGWDADIIIHDLKIAVLWNGKWHYENICKGHSILQVQNRDKIKMKEITNAGYYPYVIKDMGRHNKKFVIERFEEFKEFIKTAK